MESAQGWARAKAAAFSLTRERTQTFRIGMNISLKPQKKPARKVLY